MVHPRTQIRIPKQPKERHQEQTHTKRGAEHPVTVAGSSKAEHRTRVVETKALKTPEKAKSMQHHASVKDRRQPSTPGPEQVAKDEDQANTIRRRTTTDSTTT